MAFSLFDPPEILPQEIGILLIPAFSLICFSSIIEPMRAANRFGGDLYRWRLYSTDGQPVRSSSGVHIAVDGALDAAAGPVLLVCASFHPERSFTPALAARLRELRRRGTVLGGLDTGSQVLARAGLLDGYRVTIHWEDLEVFAERFPGVEVVPDRFVVDGDRITAGGGTIALDMVFAERFPGVEVVPDRFVVDGDRITAGGGTIALDMVLAVIRAQHGHLLALEVASQFIYDQEHLPSDPQRAVAIRQVRAQAPAVATALEIMEEAIEEPPTIAEIAGRSGVSQKELERLFKKVLRTTPGHHFLSLRLATAERLLAQTALSISEIAVRSGFASAPAFSRAYRNRFGRPPRAAR